MYRKMCIPLMLINNNVYTFLSGVFVSLSINIFTSLCFEKRSLYSGWYMYLASILFLLASALFMYLAIKLSRFQNYIIEKRVTDHEKKKSIVLDATKKTYTKWIAIYACVIVMVLGGVNLLVFNFIV